MHVNLSEKIVDLRGKVVEELVCGVLEPVTVGKVFVGALLNAPDQHMIGAADKVARFRLASRLSSGTGEFNFTDAEAVLLQDVVGKAFGTLVVGRINDILTRPGDTAG